MRAQALFLAAVMVLGAGCSTAGSSERAEAPTRATGSENQGLGARDLPAGSAPLEVSPDPELAAAVLASTTVTLLGALERYAMTPDRSAEPLMVSGREIDVPASLGLLADVAGGGRPVYVGSWFGDQVRRTEPDRVWLGVLSVLYAGPGGAPRLLCEGIYTDGLGFFSAPLEAPIDVGRDPARRCEPPGLLLGVQGV